MSAPRGYTCECNLRSCRRKIYLLPSEYRVLAQIGMVLSADCARREERTVITGYNGYRVVVASNRGKAVA